MKGNKETCIIVLMILIMMPVAIAQSISEDASLFEKSVSYEPGIRPGNFGMITPLRETYLSASSVPENLMADWVVDATTHNTSHNTSTDTTIVGVGQTGLSANIPERVNKDTINITAATKPSYIVELTIKSDFRRVIADENGSAEFKLIKLTPGDNTILLKSTSPDGNESFNATYNTLLDNTMPQLSISDVPSILGEKSVTITGTVNKKVDIQVFVKKGASDNNPPAAPTGLTANASAANTISLNWKQSDDPDFLEYVLYRSDKGPIATAQPANYISYQDIQVDPNTRYEYSMSIINKNCIESQKTMPVPITTQNQGRSLGSAATAITVSCDSSSSQRNAGTFTSNSTFNVTVPLDEGINTITIKATDLNGNSITQSRTVTVQSEPLTINIISPQSGIMIYEQFANSVKIEGKTKPFAKVDLGTKGQVIASTVMSTTTTSTMPSATGTTSSTMTTTTIAAPLPQGTITIGAVKLSTTADEYGSFVFNDVNMKTYVGGSLEPRTVPLGDQSLAGSQSNLKNYDTAYLYFRATDNTGKQQTIETKYIIGTCWGGNFTWGITPLVQYQSPVFLSSERLSEGTEEISFYFNFTYQGLGDFGTGTSSAKGKTKVTSVSVSDACDDYIKTQPSYNWSCRALSSCRATMNPDGTLAYITCHLNKIKEIEDFDGKALKDWYKSISNEMRFPLTITLAYQEQYQGQIRTGSQTSCEEVTFPVDNSQLNFSKMLPDWLLNNGVQLMDDAVKNIDKINQQLKQVMKYLAIGCVGSFIAKFGVQVYRRVTCSYDNVYKKLETATALTGEQSDTQKACNACLNAFADRAGPNNTYRDLLKKVQGLPGLVNGSVQNKIPDACLEACYPSCANAWNYESKVYEFYRWTCDRVFCHSAPSRWTETKSDSELKAKQETANTCSKDQTMKGMPLTAVKCSELAEAKRKDFVYSPDDLCFEVFNSKANQKSIFALDSKTASTDEKLTTIVKKTGPADYGYLYALKISDKYYITKSVKTCSETCGIKDKESANATHIIAPGSKAIRGGTPEGANFACTTVTNCKDMVNQGNVTVDGKVVNVKGAYPEGFTTGCFYREGDDPALSNPSAVGDNPDERYECCCLNTVAAKDNPFFYQPKTDIYLQKDTSGGLGSILGLGGGSSSGKNASAPSATASGQANYIDPPQNYSEMKWSYRYWKINFDNKIFNPDRYIKGRDQPACFGQNNWIFDGFGKNAEGNLLKVDPFKQHTSTFQCGCLSGIINRLTMIQNILMLMSGCLKEVKTTGKGDAGVCKELFTQYVCTLMWEIISYLQNGCVPLFGGINFDEEGGATQSLKVGTKSVFDSMNDNMKELSGEYGNAQINSLLGTGEGSIARAICLAAFGFDWEISLDTILDAAYSTPFATLVQPVTKSREYMSFDPRGGQAKYEYSSSWIINPGCDFDSYDVSLACVSDDDIRNNPEIDCSKVDCDCAYMKGNGPEMRFYSGRTLKQNVLEDKSNHAIITSKYRFDHLKFTLRTSSKINRYAASSKGNCFPTGHEDGIFYFPITDKTATSVVGCAASADSGVFYCEAGDLMWDKQGRAYFNSAKINDKSVSDENLTVKLGSDIFFDVEIFNAGNPKCLLIELDKPGQKADVHKLTIDFQGSQQLQEPLGNATWTNSAPTGKSGSFIGCVLKNTGGSVADNDRCKSLIPSTDRDSIGNFVKLPDTAEANYILSFVDSNNDSKIDLTADSNDTIFIDDKSEPVKSYYNDSLGKVAINRSGSLFVVNSVPFSPEISRINFKVYSPAQTLRQTERWELKYGLYYIKDGGYGCEDMIDGDVVLNNGQRMEATKSFAIKEMTETNGSSSAGGSSSSSTSGHAAPPCKRDGSMNDVECDCNGDNKSTATNDDCDGRIRKYCLTLNPNPTSGDAVYKCYGNCVGKGDNEIVPCECNNDGIIDNRDCLRSPCQCINGQISTYN